MEFINFISSPLEQFEVYNILPGLTNLSLFLLLNAFIFIFFVKFNSSENLLIGRVNIVKESLLSTVIEIVKDQLGSHPSSFRYYPLLLTLFLFILISNFLGMVPYSFTPTSHLVVTVGLSFPIMLGVTIIGLKNYKSEFFALFLPAGTPTWLIPLLTSIELISYIARAFSLGIRLFANILSGHALLHILAGFTYKWIISDGGLIIIKFAPIIFIAVLLSLEIAISFLQAYVFTVLTASYLKDVI